MNFRFKRARQADERGLLIGVRGICRYRGISPRTFYRLKRESDFPAATLPDGRWCTTMTLIDEWVRALAQAQRHGTGQATPSHSVSSQA